MKIYDISQAVFGCEVYPGDPIPKKTVLCSMENGDLYNLTEFSMCAHNGTHIDAPFHFIKNGKTVDVMDLASFVGMACVAEHHGEVLGDDALRIIEKAKKEMEELMKSISEEVGGQNVKVVQLQIPRANFKNFLFTLFFGLLLNTLLIIGTSGFFEFVKYENILNELIKTNEKASNYKHILLFSFFF